MCFVIVFKICMLIKLVYAVQNKLKIGGVFDVTEENEELAFKYAIHATNNYMKGYRDNSIKLVPLTIRINKNDVLATSKAVCQLLEVGIVGVFGPGASHSSPYIQSLCDTKEMPHIENYWDISEQRSLINFYPHPSTISKAYIDIIKEYGWMKFTILYDIDANLPKAAELLMWENKYTTTVRQLVLDSTGSYRNILNIIKHSGDTHFVINCNIDVLEEVLSQAQQVGIITEQYHYLIMNLDMHTVNLAPYQYGGSNITGVQLVNPENVDIIELAENIQKLKIKLGKSVNFFSQLDAWKINIKTALIRDAVFSFYETVNDLKLTKRLQEKSLFCNATDNWEHGYSVINFIKTKTFQGLTGNIKFDTNGLRSEFSLQITQLTSGGLNKIGTWNSTEGLNFTRFQPSKMLSHTDESNLLNKSFVVIIALTPPYGMLKETTAQLTGNERFEGYGIDLIHELSLMLGFNYTFTVQDDGANGNYNRRTKQWNGMVREILDGRADLAITDLTITSERESAVDFTMPFMNLGISILYRKPEPVPPSLFTFASPFSLQVWILLGVAYFFVSISLFIIARLCPAEWNNPFPCVEEPEFLINQFTLRNSLWFTIGSLMQQGTEIAPIGFSTRMVAGIWWFFTLIMVSSYTANLAAFLTVETLVTSFKNIEELAAQTEIRYGAKSDGATSNFFRDSDLESYKTIWKYMSTHTNDMTNDNDEGVRRVANENYAFLMESTTIEYMVERHCTLAQVGGLLDDKGYGIAMKKDSKYRNILSAAVLKLQENGKLTALKIKWWKEKRGGGNCLSGNEGGNATPLGLKNVEGVFLILVVGTVLGCALGFLELALHILRRTYKDREWLRFKNEYNEELRFMLKFRQRNKPIR